ncbi:Uncharacterised protein [Mycobacteroides abscessus subsp. abscessus]|nr:Uncharacterised protein [Mycobacteroides abscessus subsp. abscessus]
MGTKALRGAMPFTTVPSGRYTSPSALNPGPPVKPSSTRISGLPSSRPRHDGGTVPVTCSHMVDHGGPHGVPGVISWKSWPTASANGTGSPGAAQAVTVRGAEST